MKIKLFEFEKTLTVSPANSDMDTSFLSTRVEVGNHSLSCVKEEDGYLFIPSADSFKAICNVKAKVNESNKKIDIVLTFSLNKFARIFTFIISCFLVLLQIFGFLAFIHFGDYAGFIPLAMFLFLVMFMFADTRLFAHRFINELRYELISA